MTVVSESPLLQTDRADTSRIIESVHLAEVPLGFNRRRRGVRPRGRRDNQCHAEVGNQQPEGQCLRVRNNEKTNAPGYFTHTAPPATTCRAASRSADRSSATGCSSSATTSTSSDNAGRTTRSPIPPTAYRNGDFSASPTRIYDPLTGNPDAAGRTPFPNNIIPADRISPIARAIFANIPAPNVDAAPGQPNYQVDYARVKTTDSFDSKVNWQASQRPGCRTGQLPAAEAGRTAATTCGRSSTRTLPVVGQPGNNGRPLFLPFWQVGGRDDVDRQQNARRLAADRARSPLLERHPRDHVEV